MRETPNAQATIESFVFRHANFTPIDAVLGHDIYDKVVQRRLSVYESAYFLTLAEAEVATLWAARRTAAALSPGTEAKIDRLLQNAEAATACFQKIIHASFHR